MTTTDKQSLAEAADWLIRLQEAPHDADNLAQLAHWRQQSPAHEAAWQKASQLQSLLAGGRQSQIRHLLASLKPANRRRAIRAMLLAGAVPLFGWWSWRSSQPAPDYHTAVGEQKIYHLADGGQLLLNTDSAVRQTDTLQQRELHLLRGEIILTTGQDLRPLYIRTPFGSLQPVGTRFAVRLDDTAANLVVTEGAVLLTLVNGQSARIDAGHSCRFDGQRHYALGEPPAQQLAWTQGQLYVSNWPLSRVLAELSRYRHGSIRCSDDIANRRVSGVYLVRDPDAALQLLVHSHALQHYRLGPWLSWLASG